MNMSAEDNLITLGITLPEPPNPIGAYLPATRAGDLVFVSGVLPMVEGKLFCQGKLGLEIGLEEGYEAARISCINALSIIKKELGSLDSIRRIVKITGYVASTPDFIDQPKVVNGASELLLSVFGEQGKHARAAVGCSSLPADSPVEIEMIVEVEEE
jgi:enamine deaminase RidA (YjgF/YER057c/UK114 family)